jgi:hypothetical protein
MPLCAGRSPVTFPRRRAQPPAHAKSRFLSVNLENHGGVKRIECEHGVAHIRSHPIRKVARPSGTVRTPVGWESPRR